MRRIQKIFLAMVLVALAPATLFACAGGGGGFHGGGGFGGGGFGGGGGGFGGGGFSFGGGSHGSNHFDFIDLIVVIVIILFVFVIPLIKAYFSSGDPSDFPNPTPLESIPPAAEPAAIEAIRASDPTFSPEAFYARLTTAFLALQTAWSEQNLDAVRPFISDAILERFNIQFSEQKFLGYRNLMKNVEVRSIALVQVHSDHLFDTATVRIDASAIDENISPDGKRLSGEPIAEPFTEYWSFLRKRGAKSVPKGLIEGNCPNCGAAVAINQNAKCPHCSASLRSPEYDWVLTEITQESEYRPTPPDSHIPGLTDLINRDLNFTLTDLEDRTSVTFWRLSLADRTGSIDPLRKVTVPAFIEKYAARFVPDGSGHRRVYLDAGVGSVSTLALHLGDTADPHAVDHALVEIRWSGIIYLLSPNTPPQKTSEDNLIYSWYILKRSSAAKTDPATTLTSQHCPNCGAAITSETDNTCPYCNTPLPDPAHGWLLDHITPRHDSSVRQFFNLASIIA